MRPAVAFWPITPLPLRVRLSLRRGLTEASAMPRTAIIIGLPETCRQLERQLDLVPGRPVTVGWIVHQKPGEGHSHAQPQAGGAAAGAGEAAPAAATLPASSSIISRAARRGQHLELPTRLRLTIAMAAASRYGALPGDRSRFPAWPRCSIQIYLSVVVPWSGRSWDRQTHRLRGP